MKPRGERGDYVKVTITMDPQMWADLKGVGMQRVLQKQKDTDVSSLIREAVNAYYNLNSSDEEDINEALAISYKEKIKRDRDLFKPETEDLYTLNDLIHLKYAEGDRTICDIQAYFGDYLDWEIRDLTFERYKIITDNLLNTRVRRRGSAKTGTGEWVLPSVKTIRNKFAYLSSAYNFAREKGIMVENIPMKILALLRDKMK